MREKLLKPFCIAIMFVLALTISGFLWVVGVHRRVLQSATPKMRLDTRGMAVFDYLAESSGQTLMRLARRVPAGGFSEGERGKG